jgi:hypothetical protein
MNMNIDIICMINLYFSGNYGQFICMALSYIRVLNINDLTKLYDCIYWSFILDDMDYCREKMIKFIKLLNLRKQ